MPSRGGGQIDALQGRGEPAVPVVAQKAADSPGLGPGSGDTTAIQAQRSQRLRRPELQAHVCLVRVSALSRITSSSVPGSTVCRTGQFIC